MMRNKRKQQEGVTLLEILLVIIIASSIIMMILGYVMQQSHQVLRDRTTLMSGQVLNAGLSYYVNNGSWPANITTLATYIPGVSASSYNNSYGNPITVQSDSSTGLFYLVTYTNLPTDAYLIAATLPNGFVTSSSAAYGLHSPPLQDPKCAASTGISTAACTYVIAAVNIPGQNLNNARSVNFANLYRSGACVPAPKCPTNMVPEIFTASAGLAGISNQAASSNLSAIVAFYTFAISGGPVGSGNLTNAPLPPTQALGGPPISCSGQSWVDCSFGAGSAEAGTLYWRVCAHVVTTQGDAQWQGGNATATPNWASSAVILAITRCSPVNENVGSDFSVWNAQ